MILVVDNYDSFVHNLARYVRELGRDTRVVRNTEISPAGARELRPELIILSPGPCDPARAGASVPLVRELSGEVPILGVCLGHQAIAEAFGGRVGRAHRPRHGVASAIEHDGEGIFRGLPNPFPAGRYHSLVVDPDSLPADLEVTAWTRDPWGRTVMAMRHRRHPTIGVQFHPESVLTPCGHLVLANFLALVGIAPASETAREPAVFTSEAPSSWVP